MPAVLAICVANLALAQDASQPVDPLVAARTKLRTALEKTAALPDTAYRASWAPDHKNQDAQKERANLLASAGQGKVGGSWHAGLVTCTFDGDLGDELLVAGRRTLAKAQNEDWKLRCGRFADGNAVDFVPDPELLLEQLASWELAVMHRDVGSLDDHPVEVVSVALSADQVTAAVWSGLVPPVLAANTMNAFAMLLAARAGGQRPPAAQPTSTVDLAISFDPATGLVHQVQFRSWTKQPDRPGQAMVVRGGVVQVALGGQPGAKEKEEQEEAEEETRPQAGPMQYEHGLPVRPRSKQSVMDYTVRFLEHGKKAAPALSAAQQKLLRL